MIRNVILGALMILGWMVPAFLARHRQLSSDNRVDGRDKALRLFISNVLTNFEKLVGLSVEDAYLEGVRDTMKIIKASTEEIVLMIGEQMLGKEKL